MNDIDQQLAEARSRAESHGAKFGAKETADDYLKITYATLYDDAPGGSIPERDSWVKRQPAYKAAVERKRNAYADWKTAETYMRLLLVEAEVWRTKSANDRQMDRAHR